MRVFVTGGTGFLGSHLMSVLSERNHNITLLTRPTSSLQLLEGLSYTKVDGDITNPQSLLSGVPDDIEVFFHNAARMTNWGHRNRFWPQNVEGTLNALETARRKDIQTFIYTSSGVVYGFPQDSVTEDAPLNPGNIYAESKVAAELHVLDYNRNHGLDTVIFRPPLVLGKGDGYCGPMLREMAESNRFFMFGECTNPISMVHANDVARCLVDAAEKIDRTKGEIYNVVAFDSPWCEFCGKYLEATNLGHGMKKLPYSVCYGMAAIGERLYKAFNRKSAPLDNFTTWTVKLFGKGFRIDGSKIHDHIGFEPRWDRSAIIKDMLSCNSQYRPR